SQSTLSHRLFELEKEIGVSLIERKRGGKGIFLTDCGKNFLTTAKSWETLVQDTEQLKNQKNKITLSIGAVDTFHTFIFPPLYNVLTKLEPQIKLNLRTYNSTELYLQLDRGELDVAFTLLNLPMNNIAVKQVYKEPRVVLRMEVSHNTIGEYIDLKDLDESKEIFFIGDNTFHTWYRSWKGKRGYPALQVDTTQLLALFMSQEGYWSVVPLCIASKMVQSGLYYYYRLKDEPPERICYRIQSEYIRPSALEGLNILDAHLGLIFDEFKNI
ncbi:MAG: LysR family transcriptional regulator, partial [Acidaminococcaceae bacterium]|nr:LysR family transcriptional regulator [Acidaminococcaceae bacterium]